MGIKQGLRYSGMTLITVSVVLSAALGEAATYFVSQTGSDNHSCSQAANQSSAKRTIGAGISCLVARDTLTVMAGTYSESLTNPFSNTGNSWAEKITVKADLPRVVIIRPPSVESAMWFDSSSQKYVEFDGIEVDAINASVYGIGIRGTAHHIRIRNSAIFNAANQGVFIYGDSGNRMAPSGNEFINVEVSYIAMTTSGTLKTCNGSSEGTKNGYCHGFYIGTNDNLLDHVDTHHNNGYGLQFYPQGNNRNVIKNSKSHDNHSTGIGSLGNGNKVVGNLVYNNGGGGLLITESGALVANNTVVNNPGNWNGMSLQGSGHTVKNNIFYQNSVNGILDATNLVGANPLFVSGTDFHLQAGSPAIDRGTAIPEANIDIEGTPRPQGASFDAGAYEFGGSGADIISPAPPRNVRILQ